MTYTPEELRAARMTEVRRRSHAAIDDNKIANVPDIILKMWSENWQPPPKVDADTRAVRAARASCYADGSLILNGECDLHMEHKVALAAYRAGLAHARASAPNADDVAELVAAAWSISSHHPVIRGSEMGRLRKALAKFAVPFALPDSGET